MTRILRTTVAAVCTVYACTANAAVFTWDGGGADNNWQTAANWVGDIAPDSDGTASLVFAGGAAKTTANNFPAGTAFAGIALNNTAAFTLSGNDITLPARSLQRTPPLPSQTRSRCRSRWAPT